MKLPTCIICDRALICDTVNVSARGQRTLVRSSTLRNDSKFLKVLDKPVQLHVKCRSKYTNYRCIEGAVRKAARENVQICYVETVPTEMHNEVEENNVKECLIQSERLKHNSEGESFNTSIKTKVIKRDSEVKNINCSTNSQEKNRFSAELDQIQSSARISPLLDMGLPQGRVLNNQCFIEIELDKASSDGQNINDPIPEVKKKLFKENPLYKNIKTFFERTTIKSDSVGGENSLFNYQKQCLFCALDASDDFVRAQTKVNTKKRILVVKVTKRYTGDKILCHCLHYDSNDVCKEVRSRIENKDLMELGARYHNVCYSRFLYYTKLPRGKRGRPISKEIQKNMQLVFDYIDNYIEDGTEFSVDDLKRVLNVDLCEKTMKVKLVDHYGDAIDVGLPNNRIMKRKLVENQDDSEVPEDSTAEEVDITSQHSGFRCDVCLEDIIGSRYACVQCADWDLCGACEARGEHAAHYVLRVPPSRPHVEVQAVLENMRSFLLKGDEIEDNKSIKNTNVSDNSTQTGVQGEEPELRAVEDPLAAALDISSRDVLEEPTHVKEEPMLTQTDDMEQSKMDDAVTFSILTEPIGEHYDVALYAQHKTEKKNVNDETAHQETSCSLFETNYIGEESRSVSYTHAIKMPFNKESAEQSYTCFKTETSTEETQKPAVWLGMVPWSGGQSQEASCSRVVGWEAVYK